MIRCVVTSSYKNGKDELIPVPPAIRQARSGRKSIPNVVTKEQNIPMEEEPKKVNQILYRRFLKRQEKKEEKKQVELSTLEWNRRKWLLKKGKRDATVMDRKRLTMLRTWFDLLDADGSGELGLDELAIPLISTGLGKNRHCIQQLIQSVDKSGSGEINFEEFLHMMVETDSENYSTNPIIKMYNEIMDQEDDMANLLSLPVLMSAHTRKVFLNAYVSKDDSEMENGRDILRALERAKAETQVVVIEQNLSSTSNILEMDEKYRKKEKPHQMVREILIDRPKNRPFREHLILPSVKN